MKNPKSSRSLLGCIADESNRASKIVNSLEETVMILGGIVTADDSQLVLDTLNMPDFPKQTGVLTRALQAMIDRRISLVKAYWEKQS